MLLDAVDLRDVRMVERCEYLRLALESRDPIGVGANKSGRILIAEVAAQPSIGAPATLRPCRLRRWRK